MAQNMAMNHHWPCESSYEPDSKVQVSIEWKRVMIITNGSNVFLIVQAYRGNLKMSHVLMIRMLLLKAVSLTSLDAPLLNSVLRRSV